MSRTARPRYGRIAVFSASVLVTGTAVLGGVGLLPSGGSPSYAADRAAGSSHSEGAMELAAEVPVPTPSSATSPTTSPRPSGGRSIDPTTVAPSSTPSSTPSPTPSPTPPSASSSTPAPSAGPAAGIVAALPPDSGTGRRVVFDISAQRVWLVNADGSVARTYPVSGSLTDNLMPGTYAVWSRARHAIGIDNSGTMRLAVWFAHGVHAAIGFHDIPVLDGKPVQTKAQLGTPQSHGCIRQAHPDAKALWQFAPLGTKVVVTA